MSKADKQRLPEYLKHIVDAISRINMYVENMDEVGFLHDQKTQDAVIRNFEIIGEACNNVSKHHADFANHHGEIPWSFAYEMRNALAHGYLRSIWKSFGIPFTASYPTCCSALKIYSPRAFTN